MSVTTMSGTVSSAVFSASRPSLRPEAMKPFVDRNST
jgi:hypothetical protein